MQKLYKKPTKTIDKLKERLLCNPKIKMIAFNFPKDIGRTCSLSDILEKDVDKKYFLQTDRIEKMFKRVQKNKKEGRGFQPSIVDMENDGQLKPMFEKNSLKKVAVDGKNSQGNRIYSSDGVACTLQGLAGGKGAKTGLYVVPVLTPDRAEKRQNGRRFKTNGEPSLTLTSQDIHGVAIYDKKDDNSDIDLLQSGVRIRRLTPVECERLQGFPDNWTIEGLTIDGKYVVISDTQRYKTLGNAITTNVITEIGCQLAKVIK